MANCHLVILKKPYLDMILEGQKVIELRLYKTRRGALGRVRAGDRLFLKASSGPVCATATAGMVKNFENLTPEKILELKRLYNPDIGGLDEHWQSKIDCKFGFMVWLKDVRAIEPVRISKKDWRAWVVLVENEDFGLLKMAGPE
ncbi:MAG: ASCH domain-containing protein [Phycisphaerales bacterium]